MPAFGLDIGSRSIKAVQLEKSGDKFSLTAAGVTSSPAPGANSDAERDLAQVGEAIKKLVADTKISSKQVNLSLPEAKVFTRLISLPPLSDEEVAAAISWQAEPYIPIPVKEASLDFQIVDRVEAQGSTKPGRVDVLLIAAPKALIEKYVKIANFAGLSVVSVETELLALARSIAPAKNTSLVLDLGATSSDIGIVRAGQILFGRSVATAGDALTRAVSTGLSVELSQAEEYKKAYGLDPKQAEGRVRQVLEPAFRVIVDELKKAIQFYKNELKAQDDITSIVLSGGTAGMPEIIPYLTENLGLEVSIGNPFANLIGTERLSRNFAAYSPLYSISVGLAMNI